MLTRMQQRRGTQAEWNDSVIASTVILQAGELGLETDTGRFKIGNGVTVWQDLPYYLPDDNPSNVAIRQGKNNNDVYAKLSPLAPTFTQTFTGAQVLVPNSSSQIPLVVSGVTGQSAVLQRWRDSNDVTLASIDQTGKLTTANGALFNATVNMNNHIITNLPAPTGDNDATNKLYVDNAIAGLAWKEAIHLIAHGPGTNVALTGATGTLIIDGHDPLVQADSGIYRILLTAQTTATQNGIYLYTDNGTTYTLTRTTDADNPVELKGASVYVQEGTTYGTSSWVQSNYEIDTFDDQVWVQFSGAALITAGDGMTKDGNRLDVGGTADRITANADSIDIAATYVGQTSITTLGTVTTGTWDATVIDETKGGTGQSSYAVGDILYADTTTSLNKLGPGTTGYPILSNGTGNAPSYGQVNTAGIANDSVTYDKIQNISAQYRLLGRISAGAGNTQEVNPDELIGFINQANAGGDNISFNLLPVGNTSTTVAQGDHTHTLDQLSDVQIGTPALRQVIKYDGSKWINELPSGGISIGATPPVDASSGDAWFDSTDGSLYVYYDDGIGIARTNLITNPSFETNTTNWSGPNSTIAQSSAFSYVGTKSLKVTPSNASGGAAFIATTVSGTTYRFSVYVYTETNKNLKLAIESPATSSTTVAVTSGTWTRLNVSFVADSTSSYVTIVGTDSTTPFYVDAVMLEASSSVGSYFDGATAGASWTGTPHASTSTIPSTTSGTAQWVQVKANSALEASILTRISAVEAQNVDIYQAAVLRVANATERDSIYPAPVQGNTVFRADLGYEEKYYAAYNATTNPDGTTGTPGWYRYAGGAPLSPNYLINGGFDIWQRGTIFANPATKYTADRWSTIFATGNVERFVNTTYPTVAGSYGLRVTNTGTFVNQFKLAQYLEEDVVNSIKGKTVTFSLYTAITSSNPPPLSFIIDKSSTPNAGPSTFDWENILYETFSVSSSNLTRYFVTVAIPTDATAKGLKFSIQAPVDWPATYTIDVLSAQLEEGPVATPFRRNANSLQGELAACQRYYYRINARALGDDIAVGWCHQSTGARVSVTAPVTMRIAPLALETTGIASDYSVRTGITATPCNAVPTWYTSSETFMVVTLPVASGLTAGQGANLRANAATTFLAWSAEL